MLHTYLDGKNLEPYKDIVSENINRLILRKMDEIVADAGMKKEDITVSEENTDKFGRYLQRVGIVPKTMTNPKEACMAFCSLYFLVVSEETLYPSLTLQFILWKIAEIGVKESVNSSDYSFNEKGTVVKLPENVRDEIYDCVRKDFVSDMSADDDFAGVSEEKLAEDWKDMIAEEAASFERFSFYLFDYFFTNNKFLFLNKMTEKELEDSVISRKFKIFPEKVSRIVFPTVWWKAA